MTPKQQACLRAIDKLTIDGVSPSYDAIAAELGTASKSNVHRLICGLEDQGFVRRLPNRARTLEIIIRPIWLDGPAPSGVKAEVNALIAKYGRTAVMAVL